jgi:hypothetical protein
MSDQVFIGETEASYVVIGVLSAGGSHLRFVVEENLNV